MASLVSTIPPIIGSNPDVLASSIISSPPTMPTLASLMLMTSARFPVIILFASTKL
jgi:hypothetical protein